MNIRLLAGIALCIGLSFSLLAQDGQKLGLRDCIAIAMDNNIDIMTAENNAESAQKSVKAAYSGVLPNIRTSFSATNITEGPSTFIQPTFVGIDSVSGQTIYEQRETVSPRQSRESYGASLAIDQNIFDGGNWWNTIRKGKIDRDAANYGYDVQRNAVITTVTQYFFDLLKQEKLLEVNRLAQQRSQDNLDKTSKMFEIGSVAKVDVFRARVNLGNDRVAVLNQQNTVQQARQNLNIAMGREPNDALNIDTEFEFDYNLPDLQSLLATAHANHPELKRLNKQVLSQELSVKQAGSAFWPSLSAFFRYNRSNTDFEKIYSPFDQNWNTQLGLSVSYNLFNGFNDMVNVQTAKIRANNARLSMESYRLSLVSLVARLHDSYNYQKEIITIRKENLEASREEYRLANERFRLGSGTSLDIREAQVNLTDAEQILVAAEYNLILTYAELQEALGKVDDAF